MCLDARKEGWTSTDILAWTSPVRQTFQTYDQVQALLHPSAQASHPSGAGASEQVFIVAGSGRISCTEDRWYPVNPVDLGTATRVCIRGYQGVAAKNAKHLREPQRKTKELRRANEILAPANALSAQEKLERRLRSREPLLVCTGADFE